MLWIQVPEKINVYKVRKRGLKGIESAIFVKRMVELCQTSQSWAEVFERLREEGY